MDLLSYIKDLWFKLMASQLRLPSGFLAFERDPSGTKNPVAIFAPDSDRKKIFLKFPFAKFGFTLYTGEEWKRLIEENGFQFIKLENGKELEKKMDQVNTPFESLCLVCVK